MAAEIIDFKTRARLNTEEKSVEEAREEHKVGAYKDVVSDVLDSLAESGFDVTNSIICVPNEDVNGDAAFVMFNPQMLAIDALHLCADVADRIRISSGLPPAQRDFVAGFEDEPA